MQEWRPSSTVQDLLFGPAYFHRFESMNGLARHLGSWNSQVEYDNSSQLVIGVQVRDQAILRAMVGHAFRLALVKSEDLLTIRNAILDHGYAVPQIVACLPSLQNPRFLLPEDDFLSHDFLLRHILYPRRYSLRVRERVALVLYMIMVRVLRSPLWVYRSALIAVKSRTC